MKHLSTRVDKTIKTDLNRVKEVYKNYFLDFVMFNYTINEFLVTAVDDYGTVAHTKSKDLLLMAH